MVHFNTKIFLISLIIVVSSVPQAFSQVCENLDTECRYPDYHAIIFGNPAYEALGENGKIESVIKDVSSIKSILGDLGFVINGGTQAEIKKNIDVNSQINSLADYQTKIEQYISLINPGDVVVFYYSGHGFSYDGSNYIVPSNYPKDAVNTQHLFKNAINIYDVLTTIDKKKPGLIITILDSCRTGVEFPLKSLGNLIHPEIKGTHIVSKQINSNFELLFASNEGGEAIGLSDHTKNSIYTGIFVKKLRDLIKISKSSPTQHQASLDELHRQVQSLTSIETKKIMIPDRQPSTTEFKFAPNSTTWENFQLSWENVSTTKTLNEIKHFLNLNSWSQYANAARMWIEGQVPMASDGQGNSFALAAGVDEAYDRLGETGGIAAWINSGVAVRYPRQVTQGTVRNYADLPEVFGGILVGKSKTELQKQATEIVNKFGGKQAFDVARLLKHGEISTFTGSQALSAPDQKAGLNIQIPASTPLKIVDSQYKSGSGEMYARLRPIIGDAQLPQGKIDVKPTNQLPNDFWLRIGVDEKQRKADSYTNIIGRRLGEVLVPAAIDTGFLVNPESLVAKIEGIVSADREINWVSISPTFIDSNPAKVGDGETNQSRHEAIQRRISERALRTSHIKNVLKSFGIDTKTITIAPGAAGEIGNQTRVRFFGF